MEESRTHIVMVTFNGIEYTRIAIQSLFDNTKTPYNLTIVDNGSTDGTIEYIDSLVPSAYIVNFKIIKSDKNLGYGGAIMKAIKNRYDEFVCMANNDLIFSDNWLEIMQSIMDKDPDIALLGPLSPVQWCKHPYSNAHSRKVMADIPETVSVMEELEQYCFGKDYKTFVNDIKAVNKFGLKYFQGPPSHIMGFLSLVRMSAVDEVGELVEPDYYFGSDDTDLSWRLSIKGYKLAVTSDVYIHHFKHRSFKINKQDHKVIFRNINYDFFNKWKDEIYRFIKEGTESGVDVNYHMNSEDSYEYWVLRRLNETFGFWKDGRLVNVSINK